MKPMTTTGSWLLKHLATGTYREELAGDLLEQLSEGRPASWYLRQVLSAVGLGVWTRAGQLASPLLFSVLWSVAYELYWHRVGGEQAARSLAAWLVGLNVAYSSSFGATAEILPLVICVWSGLIAYVLTRGDHWRSFSALRLIAGLSISLNVVLLGSPLLRNTVGPALRASQQTGHSSLPVINALATSIALVTGTIFVLREPRSKII